MSTQLINLPQIRGFELRQDRTYVANFPLSAPTSAPSGYQMTMEVTGWEEIDYFAYGVFSEEEGRFYHLKCNHPPSRPFTEFLVPQSPVWAFSQEFEVLTASVVADSARLFIKGTPSLDQMAEVQLISFEILEEKSQPDQPIDWAFLSTVQPELAELFALMSFGPPDRGSTLVQKGIFIHGQHSLSIGDLVDSELPVDRHLAFAFSSGIPLMLLILEYWDKRDTQALELLIEVSEALLKMLADDNEFRDKHLWHPHAVAQRCIGLLGFALVAEASNWKNLNLLGEIIARHADFLRSESMYSRLDASRFHNHGLFMDMALYLVAQTLNHEVNYRSIAELRFAETLDGLIREEAGFIVSTENSPHYAYVVDVLISVANNVALSSNEGPELPEFLGLITHRSGVSPAFGDSEMAAVPKIIRPGYSPRWTVGFWCFPKLGYSVVNQFDGEHYFSARFIHTSSTPTHKHADSGSFDLEIDGVQWLIDPGFFDYGQSPESAYLRSPFAHNLAVVTESDVSFLEPVEASHWLEGDEFLFDISSPMFTGCRTMRRVSGNLRSARLSFRESIQIEGTGDKTAILVLHLGEGVVPRLIAGGVLLEHQECAISIFLQISLSPRVVFGLGANDAETSIAAPRFGEKANTYSLLFDFAGLPELEWAISVHDGVSL